MSLSPLLCQDALATESRDFDGRVDFFDRSESRELVGRRISKRSWGMQCRHGSVHLSPEHSLCRTASNRTPSIAHDAPTANETRGVDSDQA